MRLLQGSTSGLGLQLHHLPGTPQVSPLQEGNSGSLSPHRILQRGPEDKLEFWGQEGGWRTDGPISSIPRQHRVMCNHSLLVGGTPVAVTPGDLLAEHHVQREDDKAEQGGTQRTPPWWAWNQATQTLFPNLKAPNPLCKSSELGKKDFFPSCHIATVKIQGESIGCR